MRSILGDSRPRWAAPSAACRHVARACVRRLNHVTRVTDLEICSKLKKTSQSLPAHMGAPASTTSCWKWKAATAFFSVQPTRPHTLKTLLKRKAFAPCGVCNLTAESECGAKTSVTSMNANANHQTGFRNGGLAAAIFLAAGSPAGRRPGLGHDPDARRKTQDWKCKNKV